MKPLLFLLVALVAVVSLACTTETKLVYMQPTASPTPGNAAQQASLTATVAAPSPAAPMPINSTASFTNTA